MGRRMLEKDGRFEEWRTLLPAIQKLEKLHAFVEEENFDGRHQKKSFLRHFFFKTEAK
jgi:hypothetical protein